MLTTNIFPEHGPEGMIAPVTKLPIHVLYDGDCPLCRRQMLFLQRHDREGRLRYIDIRTEQDICEQIGIGSNQLEKQIHAVLPDGTVLARMDAVRATYRAIGLNRLTAPTGWPVLRVLFDLLYRFVAKYRMALSRRIDHSPKKS